MRHQALIVTTTLCIAAFSLVCMGATVAQAAPRVGIAVTQGQGYWVAASDGGVFSFGNAQFYGSMGGKPFNGSMVGIAATPDGGGYWLVASDGGVFSFGNAQFHGSMGGKPFNGSMVGIAATPDGGGYWLVASDGGVFSFGNAQFHGSMGGKPFNGSMVGMAPTPGGGYWLVASDGGVFSFGDAQFYGSMGGKPLNAPVVGMSRTRDGGGYWLVASDGGVFSFGNAQFSGAPLVPPPTTPTPTSPPASPPPPGARTAVVSLAQKKVGIREGPGNQNPFGPSVAWCALFVSWIWNHSQVQIPSTATVRGIYKWSWDRQQARSPSARPEPGDAVIYGRAGDQHTGIVEIVSPDGGLITTIEGNRSNKVSRIGPFRPSDSARYNGMPIYGFASPLPLTASRTTRAASVGARVAEAVPPAFDDPTDPVTLRALIESQVPPATTPATRALITHPALQHVPYRSGRIRVTMTGAKLRGNVILRVRHTGRRKAAVRAYRRFLVRYRDSGRGYKVRYLRAERS